MTKTLRDLKVGDRIIGIETTEFAETHTIVKINPALVITDKGGAYPLMQMGHHTVHLAA